MRTVQHLFLRASIAACATLAASLAPSVARADEPPKEDPNCVVGKDGEGFGFVLPSPGCKRTIIVDTTISAVSNGHGFQPRGGFELGYTFQSPRVETLHLGPVFDMFLTDSFADDNVDASVDLLVALRSRYWFGPKYPFMMLDVAVGPMVVVPTTRDVPNRGGVYAEAGVSLHGALGVFASIEPSWSVHDGTFALRYSIGAKTTLSGLLLILGVFACAQTGC